MTNHLSENDERPKFVLDESITNLKLTDEGLERLIRQRQSSYAVEVLKELYYPAETEVDATILRNRIERAIKREETGNE